MVPPKLINEILITPEIEKRPSMGQHRDRESIVKVINPEEMDLLAVKLQNYNHFYNRMNIVIEDSSTLRINSNTSKD